jgi:hypothetical protein
VPNPFLQRKLPDPTPWDSEKQRLWQETRLMGRWRYTLFRVVVRFQTGDLASVLLILLVMVLLAAVLGRSPGEAFQPRDLLLLFEMVPWFIPLVLGLVVFAGLFEGWGRWDLYELIAGIYAGPPYALERLIADEASLVALLNPRLQGGPHDRVIAFDGSNWCIRYENDDENRLIDLAIRPDGSLLLTRVGGDILLINPHGGVTRRTAAFEGAYIAALCEDWYLLAGEPTSYWYHISEQTLRECPVQTTMRPVVHQGCAYVVDSTNGTLAMINASDVRTIPLPQGATLIALAISADGTVYGAERAATGPKRERIVRLVAETWETVPFMHAANELCWWDDILLALTEDGLYRYQVSVGSWIRERDGGYGLTFSSGSAPLMLVDRNTGQCYARCDLSWQEERVTVSLHEGT